MLSARGKHIVKQVYCIARDSLFVVALLVLKRFNFIYVRMIYTRKFELHIK